MWKAGAVLATRFGALIDTASSLALIGFGFWVAVSSWREQRTTQEKALVLIIGSSPMLEGIPAFLAASRYGAGQINAMALVFAVATIATYLILCVASVISLKRLHLGPLERYGKVFSGAAISQPSAWSSSSSDRWSR